MPILLVKTDSLFYVYKFPQYSRQEIAAMLGMGDLTTELKQTRVYQEALEEGREEGRERGREEGLHQATRSLVLRQLERRLGALAEPERSQIDQLSLTQLESLAEALLDFQTKPDLDNWLHQPQ